MAIGVNSLSCPIWPKPLGSWWGVRHGLLPLLIDGAVARQIAALFQIAVEQLVGDAGGLGQTGIKQLLHLVIGLQIADEAADGEADADQGQDAGEQEAADGADATHGAGYPLAARDIELGHYVADAADVADELGEELLAQVVDVHLHRVALGPSSQP